MNQLFTFVFSLVVAASPVAAATPETLKIMPLGDSPTGAGGYRGHLYRHLVDAGYKVDFVGNMKGQFSKTE